MLMFYYNNLFITFSVSMHRIFAFAFKFYYFLTDTFSSSSAMNPTPSVSSTSNTVVLGIFNFLRAVYKMF